MFARARRRNARRARSAPAGRQVTQAQTARPARRGSLHDGVGLRFDRGPGRTAGPRAQSRGAPQRRLDPVLERPADRRRPRARSATPRGPPPASSRAPGARRRPRPRDARRPDGRRRAGRDPRRGDLLLELEDDPLGELLADPRDRHEHRLVLLQDRELEVRRRARRRRSRARPSGPTPVTVSSRLKKPELLGRPEPEQRLLVLADEVVGVELEPAARLGRRRGPPAPRTPGSRSRRPRRRANRRRSRRRRPRPTRSSGGAPSQAGAATCRAARRTAFAALRLGASASRTARSYGVSPRRSARSPTGRGRPPPASASTDPGARVGDADRDRERVGGVVRRRQRGQPQDDLRPSAGPAACRRAP